MANVLLLGASGMLGSMIARVFEPDPEMTLTTTVRSAEHGSGRSVLFDARTNSLAPLLESKRFDWVINAIGIIRPRIDEHSSASIADAITVNAEFPHRLAEACARREQRVIQIATDGVFSGGHAPYDEAAPHDPTDVYGKTKSLGEVPAENVMHMRCSIIGPEAPPAVSLLGWALSSPPGTRLRGFSTQRWNGITTLHFAKLSAAVIRGAELPSPQHVVPADAVSKTELLKLALSAFGRDDVSVLPDAAAPPIDRVLTTRDPASNRRLWAAAGYGEPPTVAKMLAELVAHGRGPGRAN